MVSIERPDAGKILARGVFLVLRSSLQASAAIGNMELKTKFEQAANKIRRGIVFAASLYL